MSRTDKIILYVIILLTLFTSYFIRNEKGDQYIKIEGTTKYYYLSDRNSKDTLIVDEKDIPENDLLDIKIGLYDQ
jgi:hypothetical protein